MGLPPMFATALAVVAAAQPALAASAQLAEVSREQLCVTEGAAVLDADGALALNDSKVRAVAPHATLPSAEARLPEPQDLGNTRRL